MSTNVAPRAISFASVLLLTVLSVIFLSATITAGFFGVPAAYFPRAYQSVQSEGVGLFRLASLVICPIAYFLTCAFLTGKQARRWAAVRYTLLLQLQALVELLANGAMLLAVVGALYLFAAVTKQLDFEQYLRRFVEHGDMAVLLYVAALSLPALSMLMTVWRLHALARKPGVLVAAVNGTLCRKAVQLNNDADDVRNALVHYLQRLTGPAAPELGRVIYGRHPGMTSRETNGEVVHTLVWATCPTKLLVSCRTLGDGGQEVGVRCALRSGFYRIYLTETPVDAVAQMEYIDAHLLRPLTAQLAKISAERQRDAMRDQAVATQLRILQAQIEPHFLFNTLANVRQLYRDSVAAGESMMDHLIAYLRCAMDDLRAEHSSVVKEMDVAMHFLSIMKIRMGERLSYQFSIPESLLHHAFPPAMLISLIENAIKHGLANCDHGEITMSAARDGRDLRVTVADNGAGFSSVGGTGVGLSNIRQRLEAMYGSRAWLEVGAPASGGFTATIVIPFEERNH
jgi:signal transduction histidine kinase